MFNIRWRQRVRFRRPALVTAAGESCELVAVAPNGSRHYQTYTKSGFVYRANPRGLFTQYPRLPHVQITIDTDFQSKERYGKHQLK